MNLNNLSSPILVLVVAAVMLVIGLVVMQGIDTARTDDTSVTVTNETGAYINATGYTLTAASKCGFNTPVITNAVNTTSNTTILAANYTVSAAGVLSNITTEIHDPVIFSYTYLWGDEACEAVEDTIDGLGSMADFWEIIVLAIVASLIVGLLLNSFGRRTR